MGTCFGRNPEAHGQIGAKAEPLSDDLLGPVHHDRPNPLLIGVERSHAATDLTALERPARWARAAMRVGPIWESTCMAQ